MIIEVSNNELLGYSLPQEFINAVSQMCYRLGANTEDMLDVMNFETGGTFSPSIKNKSSGATGLIQFMPSTAKSLGTTTASLSKMSALQQLVYVEKYLKPYAGKIGNLLNLSMAIFYPVAIGKPDYKFPPKVVKQNPGIYTPRDYVAMVQGKRNKTNKNYTSTVKEKFPPFRQQAPQLESESANYAIPLIASGLGILLAFALFK